MQIRNAETARKVRQLARGIVKVNSSMSRDEMAGELVKQFNKTCAKHEWLYLVQALAAIDAALEASYV